MTVETFDITGKSLDEAMEMTAASIDKHIAEQLLRDEVFIADRGATKRELASFMEDRKRTLDTWKTDVIAEIRRGLDEPTAPSAKLQ
ncbi:hypothetical protein FJ960_01925 [Mesorhizobium sp. B2-3-11]|uniref:hypothetical protein n=1 Tax=Mesorhizobium sp. B2-3-11 TaxID=2589953 RepID=UPI00112AA982|nr:hypothetical protein [Mesorhizobium sp. B2-3-11]TPM11525.1 hypothetical protein FJ960_01925 [Mesorhizobium sp. B2-3-11]